jgi:hypothetical protein
MQSFISSSAFEGHPYSDHYCKKIEFNLRDPFSSTVIRVINPDEQVSRVRR